MARFATRTYFTHDGALDERLSAEPATWRLVTVWPNFYVTDPTLIVGWTAVWETT